MKDKIEITFTEEDVKEAEEFIATRSCLIVTALAHRGYGSRHDNSLHAGPQDVTINGRPYNIIGDEQIIDLYEQDGRIVRPDTVGKTVTLTPIEDRYA